MTNLQDELARLGLSQYLEAFVNEGFDAWETLMDVTESDLEALGVKLGHRRKLQRAIVNSAKDVAPLGALSQSGSGPEDGARNGDKAGRRQQESSSAGASANMPPSRGKRKYRRHPKPDEYAPERPPSAYVIFSNRKGQDLSFTEIAKAVGERWQELNVHEKEPCESEAQALKDRYHAELGEYKKTPQYAQYQSYLTEFKAKHSDQRNPQGTCHRTQTHNAALTRTDRPTGLDSKKQKLPDSSGASQQTHDPRHARGGGGGGRALPMPDGESSVRSPDSAVSSNGASATATSPDLRARYRPDSPDGSERSAAQNRKSPNPDSNFRRFPPPQQVSEDGHQRNHLHLQHKLPRRKPFPLPLYHTNAPTSSRHPPLPSLIHLGSTSPTLQSQYTLPPLDNSLTLGRTMPMPTPMAASSSAVHASDIKAKTSLATLLRASEHVDRDADRSNTSSGSSRTPQS